MNQLILGIILGSVLTGTLALAGSFYDSKGQPAAPRGSIQQFDYYRQRQQFLDLNAIRRAQEQARGENPCAR